MEGGAVGGEPPQTSHRRFDAAVEEADEDFASHDETATISSQPNQSQTNESSQNKPPQTNTKPYAKFFQGGIFPRFIVIKHQNAQKNIVTENMFAIGKGLREAVSNKHYKRLKLTKQFNSRLLLIEVDEKITAERLLETRMLMNIPVKVEVHQTRNSCKGVIFNDYFEMTDDELQKELSSQLVTNTYRILNSRGEKTRTIILTFASQTPPARIFLEELQGLSVEVHPYKQKPRQCPSCLRFGHGPKFCKMTKLCHKCGKPADHPAASCDNTMKCFNCEGNHSALSRANCPYYTVEEAVLNLKESTGSDIESCRDHVLRTHHLIDSIPKLKQKRDSMRPLIAKVVAGRATSQTPGGRSQQRGEPPAGRPPMGQPPVVQPQPPPSLQDPGILTKINEMLTEKLAPLTTIPQQLAELKNTLTTTTNAQKDEISALQNTLRGIENTVDILINIPIIKDQYIKALAERDCANQNLGALSDPKGSARDSLPPPHANVRKSRSREKHSRGRTTPQSRSMTPVSSARIAEPTTPGGRGNKRKLPTKTSPTSGGEDKEDSSSPKNTAGGDKDDGHARKACRSSSQGPGSLSQAEPDLTAGIPEHSNPPEVVMNPATLQKGEKPESGYKPRMIRTSYS